MSEENKKTTSSSESKALTGCFGNTHYHIEERDFLQRELLKKLEGDSISKRPGPNGQNVHYIETWKAIELANLVFGFNGWSSSIMEINNDYIEQTQQGKFNCGVSAIIRVSLKDGSFHEDIGYGVSDNQKHRGAAYEQAKKTAVSDGLKRALRNFGNALGLTIYDREHIKQISKPSLLKKLPGGVQPKPTNPYFSQNSPSQSSVINTTQQHLESISSTAPESTLPSQVLVDTPIKQENDDNLQIDDDDIDLDSSVMPEVNHNHGSSNSARPAATTQQQQQPAFQRPAQSASSSNNSSSSSSGSGFVFQRPKRPTGGVEASPPGQPAQKKNKQ